MIDVNDLREGGIVTVRLSNGTVITGKLIYKAASCCLVVDALSSNVVVKVIHNLAPNIDAIESYIPPKPEWCENDVAMVIDAKKRRWFRHEEDLWHTYDPSGAMAGMTAETLENMYGPCCIHAKYYYSEEH